MMANKARKSPKILTNCAIHSVRNGLCCRIVFSVNAGCGEVGVALAIERAPVLVVELAYRIPLERCSVSAEKSLLRYMFRGRKVTCQRGICSRNTPIQNFIGVFNCVLIRRQLTL